MEIIIKISADKLKQLNKMEIKLLKYRLPCRKQHLIEKRLKIVKDHKINIPRLPILNDTIEVKNDKFMGDFAYGDSHRLKVSKEFLELYNSQNKLLSRNHFTYDNGLLSVTKNDGSITLYNLKQLNENKFELYKDNRLLNILERQCQR